MGQIKDFPFALLNLTCEIPLEIEKKNELNKTVGRKMIFWTYIQNRKTWFRHTCR